MKVDILVRHTIDTDCLKKCKYYNEGCGGFNAEPSRCELFGLVDYPDNTVGLFERHEKCTEALTKMINDNRCHLLKAKKVHPSPKTDYYIIDDPQADQ